MTKATGIVIIFIYSFIFVLEQELRRYVQSSKKKSVAIKVCTFSAILQILIPEISALFHQLLI